MTLFLGDFEPYSSNLLCWIRLSPASLNAPDTTRLEKTAKYTGYRLSQNAIYGRGHSTIPLLVPFQPNKDTL